MEKFRTWRSLAKSVQVESGDFLIKKEPAAGAIQEWATVTRLRRSASIWIFLRYKNNEIKAIV